MCQSNEIHDAENGVFLFSCSQFNYEKSNQLSLNMQIYRDSNWSSINSCVEIKWIKLNEFILFEHCLGCKNSEMETKTAYNEISKSKGLYMDEAISKISK